MSRMILIVLFAASCVLGGTAKQVMDSVMNQIQVFDTLPQLIHYLAFPDSVTNNKVFGVKELTGRTAGMLIEGGVNIYVTTHKSGKIFVFKLDEYERVDLGQSTNEIKTVVCSKTLGLLLLERDKDIEHSTVGRIAGRCDSHTTNLTGAGFQNNSFTIHSVYITSSNSRKQLEDFMSDIFDKNKLDLSYTSPKLQLP